MTPWSRRKYIEELLILEQYLERASRGEKPAMGWASNMHYGSLKQQYPVETECILAEFSGSQAGPFLVVGQTMSTPIEI